MPPPNPFLNDDGLFSPRDRHQGFNTPSLVGAYHNFLLLHNRRTKSLCDLLAGPHGPTKTSGTDEFSDEELHDLIAYLKSL